MRRILAMLMAALLCVTACCACRPEAPVVNAPQIMGSEELEALQQLQTPYIGILLKSLDGEFYPLIKAGAEAEADRLGVEVVVVAPDQENDAAEQAELLNIMADMALDVLIISPCDESLLTEGLQKAQSTGKRMLAVDEILTFPGCEGYIGSDDFDGGFREGQFAASIAVAPSAIVLHGSESSRNHRDRTRGILESMRRSGIEETEAINCEETQTEAYRKTNRLLNERDEVGVICTTDDDMAQGAQQAVEESGRSIPVVSFDGTPQVLRLVQQEKIDGVMMQDAYGIGVQSVRDAVRLYHHETVGTDYVAMRLVVPTTAAQQIALLEERLNNNNKYKIK